MINKLFSTKKHRFRNVIILAGRCGGTPCQRSAIPIERISVVTVDKGELRIEISGGGITNITSFNEHAHAIEAYNNIVEDIERYYNRRKKV